MIGSFGSLAYSDCAGLIQTMALNVGEAFRSRSIVKPKCERAFRFCQMHDENMKTIPIRSKEKQPIHGNYL